MTAFLPSLFNFSVEMVSDGLQALEAVKKKRFDIVFMDCMVRN
jgi:CheY-like chemotaxis protein